MLYPGWLDDILRCPETGQPLTPIEGRYRRADGKVYPIRNGVLSSAYPATLSGADVELNRM